jgi:hypothetical protein
MRSDGVIKVQAVVDRIDVLVADLLRWRAEVQGAADQTLTGSLPDQDCDADFSPENLIDTLAAAERFGIGVDTARKWAREGCGTKIRGRQYVSIPRAVRRMNGRE